MIPLVSLYEIPRIYFASVAEHPGLCLTLGPGNPDDRFFSRRTYSGLLKIELIVLLTMRQRTETFIFRVGSNQKTVIYLCHGSRNTWLVAPKGRKLMIYGRGRKLLQISYKQNPGNHVYYKYISISKCAFFCF